jgi:benzoylsuccinyl-CoA thiolase BbsB subunit
MSGDRDVVVLGVGLHPFGRFPDRSLDTLARHAALAALDDAGMAFDEIEAGFLGRVGGTGPPVGVGTHIFSELGQHGIPVTNVELACGSSSRAIMHAADMIRAGSAETAMVIGVEKMERGMLQPGGVGSVSYASVMGLNVMPAAYAMRAQKHMADFGTKPEHFAQVSVKSHRNAMENPYAQYRIAITLEEVLASRMVCDPLTLYQCCPTSDGASAVVLTSAAYARKHATSAVKLVSWAGGSPVYSDGHEGLGEGPTGLVARKAYERGGIGPEDINVTQVHDAFTPGEILTIEELGYVEHGEGGPFVFEGGTEITGRCPVNTDGGLLSRGHPMGATGGAMVTEIVRQLRGQAGARQVAHPKTGLVQNAGIGGVNILVLAA